MSRDIIKETGVDLLLADTRREAANEKEGNFEIVIQWNEEESSIELNRVVPDDDGNSHFKLMRDMSEYDPTIDIVLEYLVGIRKQFPETELHIEAENMASIYFPCK